MDKEQEKAYEQMVRLLATGFVHLLDDNRREDRMCLSSAEGMDIENAFRKRDWCKLLRYVNKYIKND